MSAANECSPDADQISLWDRVIALPSIARKEGVRCLKDVQAQAREALENQRGRCNT
jgi:hypothetical protein